MFVWADFTGSNICRKWVTGKLEETHFEVSMKWFLLDVFIHTFSAETEPNRSEAFWPISSKQRNPNAPIGDSSQKLKAYLIKWTELWSTCISERGKIHQTNSCGLAAALTEAEGNFSYRVLRSRMWGASHACLHLLPPLPVLPRPAPAPDGVCQLVMRTDFKLSTNLLYQTHQGTKQCKSE